MNELEEQIKVVAEARRESQVAKGIVKDLRDKWETDYSVILAECSLTTTVMEEAETLLRELTLKAYAETGNKAPAVGVGIREVTKLEYNPTTAFGWAMEHRIAIKLDVSVFEKIAKTAPETKPGFVTITTEPQATISSNL